MERQCLVAQLILKKKLPATIRNEKHLRVIDFISNDATVIKELRA